MWYEHKQNYEMDIYWIRLIGLVDRMFANDPGDKGSLQGRVIPKT